MPQSGDVEEAESPPLIVNSYRPYYNPLHPKPVEVAQYVKYMNLQCTASLTTSNKHLVKITMTQSSVVNPSLGPCSSTMSTVTAETTAQTNEVASPVFPKSRDRETNHLSAFLSYLRLSIYMAIVSIAIVVSFHLKSKPSELELRMALPLGIVFWFLALGCLLVGFGNYIKTVTKYSRRAAIVQTGWKTQVVSANIQHILLAREAPSGISIYGTAADVMIVLYIDSHFYCSCLYFVLVYQLPEAVAGMSKACCKLPWPRLF